MERSALLSRAQSGPRWTRSGLTSSSGNGAGTDTGPAAIWRQTGRVDVQLWSRRRRGSR